MRDTRFWFGLLATILWLGYLAYMIHAHAEPTGLNEWGDVFSGFFAPLAFLWLVIGYLQQGEELRHSTEALRLQAEELRNSVEQQSQLVAVSREQMNQELGAMQEERERRRDLARPKFVPQQNGATTNSGVTTHRLRLANVGNTATNIAIVFEPRLEAQTSLNHPLVRRDEAIEMQLRMGTVAESIAAISYVDSDGVPGQVRFLLKSSGEHTIAIGSVERVI